MIESFLRSVAVVDTETTDREPEHADIIELGVTRLGTDGNWQTVDCLFGSKEDIPPAASAVNNISNKMIAGKATFIESTKTALELLDIENTSYFVAHNVQFDLAVFNANFKRADMTLGLFAGEKKTRWLCTYRLALKLVKGDGVSHSQQFLRYYLNLDIDDSEVGSVPHRAGFDSYICAHLLMKLVELAIEQGKVNPNEELGPQLVSLCWDHQPITAWPFGKYKDQPLSDIPLDYYSWALDNMDSLNKTHYRYDEDLAEAVRKELEKRLDL